MKEKNKRKIEELKLNKLEEIAYHYGFVKKDYPVITKNDESCALSLDEDESLGGEHFWANKTKSKLAERISFLKQYDGGNMYSLPQPIMVHYAKNDKNKNQKSAGNLEIFGSNKSIIEATIIHVAKIMLEEQGYKNIVVHINSTGDKESMQKFYKELVNHYRKHISALHADCRQIMKKSVWHLSTCNHKECKEIHTTAPQSTDYLSDSGRTHFQEILEYLESLNISYKINNSLNGIRAVNGGTTFALIGEGENKKENELLAVGLRYDGLAKKIGLKKDIPAVGLNFIANNKIKALEVFVKNNKKPWIYFAQIGVEAKLLSLNIIEMLRQAKIPVYQSLPKDKMIAQMNTAEKLNIPYQMIMGKKEAVEKTVIIRDYETRTQSIVPISQLIDFIKVLEKKLLDLRKKN